jgi:DNA-binding NarL/FixJ family response regulator
MHQTWDISITSHFEIMFKILIVDPNAPFRRSLRKVLINRFPFVDIREASDGSEGLEMVQGFGPHLIFLEIHLPSASGLDLARQIKADHPEIIIIILTSYDSPEYQIAAEKSGVERLVPKDDWTGEDMIDLVYSILSESNVCDQKLLVRHRQPGHSS